MPLLQVEIADFVEAAEVLHDHVGGPVSLAVGRLSSALSGCGGMAGDDPGGCDWAHVYDRAARSTLRATGQVVNAAFTTASMFGRSAMNYADAETASTTSGSQRPATSAELQRLPGTSFVGPPRMPPAADGGTSDPPTGWWLIQHTVGYVWPTGHQDQLHRAAAAWTASAAALDDAAFETFRAGTLFSADHLPEAGDILTVTRGLSDHLSDLAAAHRGLADACTDLAHHIDECHSAVEHELVELLAWTAGIQTVGAIASVFTLGAAEAPTQAAQAAKIAQTAGVVGSLIAKCLTAARTVATTIAPIVLASDRLAAVLEMLATSKLAASAASAVPAVLRTAKTGSKGVSLVKKARAEVGALQRVEKSINLRKLQIDRSQLEDKFKHADVLGVTAPRGRKGFAEFGRAIKSFVGHRDTVRIFGDYRRQNRYLHYNVRTRVVVVETVDGKFLSCWRMSPEQLRNVVERGSLGGG